MSNAPSADTDPWDRPLDDSGKKAVSARHKPTAPSSTVPDDWDDASSSEEDNQKIWDDANKRAPMPQLVVTSGPVSSVVPPASAFQPPIRILKRSAAPTQNYAGDESPASAINAGTFAERSARYNAARERIFAGTTEGSVGSGDGVPGPVSAIIRNPKGPEYTQGPHGQGSEGSLGFGGRAGKRGSSSQKQGQPLQDSDSRTG